MSIKRKMVLTYLPVVMLALVLSGCAGSVKNMQTVAPENIVTAPDEGKSMIVFMRPSGIGFAIQSSVFEIDNDMPSLVGIVAAKTKVAAQVEPGSHLFMVIGESADYMTAELEANKTYYALVTPRMGVWKARFSLQPVHGVEFGSSKFNDWSTGCKWVEKSPESDQWEQSNMVSIKAKHKEYYEDWMAKDSSERPKLLAEDGRQ